MRVWLLFVTVALTQIPVAAHQLPNADQFADLRNFLDEKRGLVSGRAGRPIESSLAELFNLEGVRIGSSAPLIDLKDYSFRSLSFLEPGADTANARVKDHPRLVS